MQRFQFKLQGSPAVANAPVVALWNKIRLELLPHIQTLFEATGKQTFNEVQALKILVNSQIKAEETYCFFDMIFDIS